MTSLAPNRWPDTHLQAPSALAFQMRAICEGRRRKGSCPMGRSSEIFACDDPNGLLSDWYHNLPHHSTPALRSAERAVLDAFLGRRLQTTLSRICYECVAG